MIALEWGPATEAQQALASLIARIGETDPASVAAVYAWRGEPDHAFEWLERAYDRRVGLSEIKTDPLFRKIRGDPRFAALLRKMGLPAP